MVSSASSKRSGARIDGQPLGQHGFAGAGRADHEDVVAAGGGYLQSALGSLLAANIFEVEGKVLQLVRADRRVRREAAGAWMPPLAAAVEQLANFEQVVTG